MLMRPVSASYSFPHPVSQNADAVASCLDHAGENHTLRKVEGTRICDTLEQPCMLHEGEINFYFVYMASLHYCNHICVLNNSGRNEYCRSSVFPTPFPIPFLLAWILEKKMLAVRVWVCMHMHASVYSVRILSFNTVFILRVPDILSAI